MSKNIIALMTLPAAFAIKPVVVGETGAFQQARGEADSAYNKGYAGFVTNSNIKLGIYDNSLLSNKWMLRGAFSKNHGSLWNLNLAVSAQYIIEYFSLCKIAFGARGSVATHDSPLALICRTKITGMCSFIFCVKGHQFSIDFYGLGWSHTTNGWYGFDAYPSVGFSFYL